jgi:hypothetical protein
VKTLLIGDPHQLAPVKARGGMFEQFCTDAPWTQRLSEVWRMHDLAERTASLALREGGPAPVRRAVEWYRRHDRLHTGDPIAMAADALAAYRADRVTGKDALLVTDTLEMADALNRRLHDREISPSAPTVTGARGHRIAVGDVVITRRNDHTIDVIDPQRLSADPVRNGHRWIVTAVDGDNRRIAAQRLGDGAHAVLANEYLRQHVCHGYATTVHAAQGVTADTTHAVLGDTSGRALLYVALTRGRERNNAYLYERLVGQADHEHSDSCGVHHLRRGDSRHAASVLRGILSQKDHRPATVHSVAAEAEPTQLPPRVRSLLSRHDQALAKRRTEYSEWMADTQRPDRHQTVSQAQWLRRLRPYDSGRDRGTERNSGLGL